METTMRDFGDREPPSIRYRGGGEPTVVEGGREPAAEAPRPAVLRWLTWGIFGVVVAIWAVVGAVVWIPLLLRAMLRFSAALVEATLDGARPTHAAATLQGAVDFYRRGFVLTWEAVHGPTLESGRATPVRTRRLLRELAWAAVVWYLILAVLGVVWSPLEIGAWLWALPWNDWAVQLGAWITEPFVSDPAAVTAPAAAPPPVP